MKIDIQDGKNVFLISDIHFGHSNIVKYDSRPFFNDFGEPDLGLMHKTILQNWNSVVKKNDVVFYLGDLYFSNNGIKEYVHRLNGQIHYILGNHDNAKDIAKLERFATINDYLEVNIIDKAKSNLHFILMHYPILSWNRKHRGSFMVHGHEHMNFSDGEFHKNNRIIDVGCNGWNYTPVSYEEIVKRLENIKY